MTIYVFSRPFLESVTGLVLYKWLLFGCLQRIAWLGKRSLNYPCFEIKKLILKNHSKEKIIMELQNDIFKIQTVRFNSEFQKIFLKSPINFLKHLLRKRLFTAK